MPLSINLPKPEPPSYTLLQGDCLELMNTLEEESVDMIFSDPPYFLSNGGFTCVGGQRTSVNKGEWDEETDVKKKFAFHHAWIRACKRLLRPGGTLWVSGTYHSIYLCGAAVQLEGMTILNDVSWFKPNAPPNLSCRRLTASHETLLWVRKGEEKHTFNYDLAKQGDWSEDKLKNQGKQMRSVWSIPSTPKREKEEGSHPTQKPLSLLRRIVLLSTNPGDTVLDPFCGSSTTGVASLQLNRNYLGIEQDSDYFTLSKKRIESLL